MFPSLSNEPTPQEAEDWLIAYEAKLAQVHQELRDQAKRNVKVPQWGNLGPSTDPLHPDELLHKSQCHHERNYYGRYQ